MRRADPSVLRSGKAAVSVTVDPRVELFSIIFRLAGSPFYTDPAVDEYDQQISSHFAPYRRHPAVRLARSLPRPWGWSGPSALSLALQTAGLPDLQLRYPHRPFAAGLESWSWRRRDADAFLAAARAFARDTRFDAFLAVQQPFYARTEAAMKRCLNRWGHLEWLDWFFGPMPGCRLHVVVAPLTGDRNYGARCASRTEADLYAIIAPSRAGVPKRARFGRVQAQIVMHEFSHSYVNPIVDGHVGEFRPSGEKLFAQVSSTMASMGYPRWDITVYESIIRAAEVRYRLKYEGPRAAAEAAAGEHERGFAWVGALADLLGEYEARRQHYPALESFVPELVRFFAKLPPQLA